MNRRRFGIIAGSSLIFGSGCMTTGSQTENTLTDSSTTALSNQSSTTTSSDQKSFTELDPGQHYVTVQEVKVVVIGVEFRRSIPGDSSTPDEGMIFVFLNIYAKNNSEQVIMLPDEDEFHLVIGDQQYEMYIHSRAADGDYSGGNQGEVAPGVERKGYVVFQIPEKDKNKAMEVMLTLDKEAVFWSLDRANEK